MFLKKVSKYKDLKIQTAKNLVMKTVIVASTHSRDTLHDTPCNTVHNSLRDVCELLRKTRQFVVEALGPIFLKKDSIKT